MENKHYIEESGPIDPKAFDKLLSNKNSIKPEEFRIGNLINKNSNAVSVDLGILRKIQNGSIIYKPIPITEEWLLKLGYIANDPFVGEKPTIFTHGIHKIWKPFDQFMDNNYRFEIKYVHQLQNLYFALSGEELQLKK